jgi:PAS domain S-box-containing protein
MPTQNASKPTNRDARPRRDKPSAADALGLLQAGLDRIDQGISVFDAELRLVGWNRRFLDLLALPAERVYRGARFAELIRFNALRGEYGQGDVEAQVEERVARARAFRPHAMERTRPDGTIVAIQGEPLPGGGFVTVYTDVTRRRRAERRIHEQTQDLERRVEDRTQELQAAHDELLAAVDRQKEIARALRRSEQRLLLIADSLPAGIAYWDKDLHCLFANRRFAAAFGSDKQAMIGRPAAEVVGENTLNELRDQIATVRSGAAVTFEYDARLPGGRTPTIRTWLVPEVHDQGGIAGFFILSLNITRQKKAEAAILQAAKMEAVGQLSSGIAHDFNNLLTIVLGNLVPLAERWTEDGGRGDVLHEFVEPAIEAARKGAGLTQRLLSFARRQALEPRPVDIEDLLAALVRLLRRSLPSDVEIVTATRGASYPALVDPHQLENALLNLALNARDAMPKGGRLTFETTFVALDAADAGRHGVAAGDYVRISVADAGSGMDEETRARAFEPFFTTKRSGAGSGLGLSMVYGFASQSRGAVDIDSAPGRGTSVAILLPRAQRVGGQAADDARPAPFNACPDDLVLLVEDDAEVRAVIRRQLMGFGYRLVEARDADEALALLQDVDGFTLMLSDVVMPGACNGIELGERARALRPGLKVVLMTGYAGAERDASLDRCPFEVLRKPFDEARLVAALSATDSTGEATRSARDAPHSHRRATDATGP